jgi:lipoprotein-releasing system ATP-binding protein
MDEKNLEMAKEIILQSKGIKYRYDQGVTLVLPDIAASIGDKVLILGQSGAGKTTLLHILSGLLTLQSGSLEIKGVSLNNLKGQQLDAFRGKEIGIIFQKPHFVASLSIIENILLAQSLANMPKDKARAQYLLDTLNIGSLSFKKPHQLSVGEQQRANIARAFINKPSIVLADEPTSALDDINCNEVLTLMNKATESEGATLLIVTHDQRLKDVFSNQILLEHHTKA